MNPQRMMVKWLLGAAAMTLVMAAALPAARAEELKLEAQLIWGANSANSPDPKHKPVEANVAKKLKKLPFKWSYYFEVNRKQFTARQSGAQRVRMSEDCEITVSVAENQQLEVVLIGKGKQVSRIKQALPKKELLVLAGDAPNLTAWFVVLKRAD